MPDLLYEISDILGSFLRLLGMAAFGLAIAWFALEVLRKGQQVWQLQIAVFLGTVGLGIAMVHYLWPGPLGAFGIGFGVALLIWGLPKKEKK